MAKPLLSPGRPHRRPISGPALIVLALVLAGIWFGSRALSQTATVSVDTEVGRQNSEVGSTPAATTVQPSTTPAPTPSSSSPAASEPVKATTTQPGLPDGYPTDIPAPTGGTLIKATAVGKPGDRSFVASYQLAGAPSVVSEAYQRQLEAAGFSVHAVLGSRDSAFFGAEKGSRSLSVSVGADQEQSGSSNLTITTGE